MTPSKPIFNKHIPSSRLPPLSPPFLQEKHPRCHNVYFEYRIHSDQLIPLIEIHILCLNKPVIVQTVERSISGGTLSAQQRELTYARSCWSNDRNYILRETFLLSPPVSCSLLMDAFWIDLSFSLPGSIGAKVKPWTYFSGSSFLMTDNSVHFHSDASS